MKYRIHRYITTEGQYREYRYLAPAKKKKAAVTLTAEMAAFSWVAGIPAAEDKFGVSRHEIRKARKIFQNNALQA
jgi:hypothetical protein